jgi:hypothetical protein
MIEFEPFVGALIAILLFFGIQITKLTATEFMSKYGRWAAVVFGVLGGVLGIVYYLATHDGHIVVENNNWEAVLIIIQEFITGFGIGIAPVGLYGFVRPVSPNLIKSSDELLAGKQGIVTTHTIDLNVASEKDLKAVGVEVTENKETEIVEGAGTITLKSKTPKKTSK